jgi:hypothetical protein
VTGAIVDRLPQVRVMIGVDLVRAALAFALPFVDASVAAITAPTPFRRTCSRPPRWSGCYPGQGSVTICT